MAITTRMEFNREDAQGGQILQIRSHLGYIQPAPVMAAWVNLASLAARAWDAASAASSHAAGAWQASSAGCRGAMAHAVAECGGFSLPVAQYTPGFGPIALAWGWCLVGVLCGLLIGLCFEQVAHRAASLAAGWGRLAQAVAGPPGLAAMPPWHQTVRGELAAAAGPRRVILQRLSDDGEAALDLLAAAGGVTRRDALARVLGVAAVRANAAAWGL